MSSENLTEREYIAILENALEHSEERYAKVEYINTQLVKLAKSSLKDFFPTFRTLFKSLQDCINDHNYVITDFKKREVETSILNSSQHLVLLVESYLSTIDESVCIEAVTSRRKYKNRYIKENFDSIRKAIRKSKLDLLVEADTLKKGETL